MASILAFAGSNSTRSINLALVRHTASLITQYQVTVLDMAQLTLPMYSEDREREEGFTEELVQLGEQIKAADGIVLAVNEHNSNPSAFFKNLVDWLSRWDRYFLEDTPVLLMATSAGKRGAIGSLEVVEKMLPRFKVGPLTVFSLPFFKEFFNPDTGIVDPQMKAKHQQALEEFLEKIA